MKLCEFYKTDYRVGFVNCLRQYWRQTKEWSCIGSPRSCNLLFAPDGCSVHYILSSGRELHASSGDVILVPKGSEYSVTFGDFCDDTAGTVGVNFDIYGDECLSPNEVEILSSPAARACVMNVERLSSAVTTVPAQFNVEVYKALTALGECSDGALAHTENHLISPGVEYLHSHLSEDVSLGELAAMCNVSEVYFRRLFKESFGIPPSGYRLEMRLARACEYLTYTGAPIAEISDMLGFSDVSYFIKRFRERYSVSPGVYREQNSNKLEK